MNIRSIGVARVVLTLLLGLLAGPALAGLDFTPPQLPYEPPAPSEPETRERADIRGIEIAPGVSLSPDIEGPSPNAATDPTNLWRVMEPWIRLQVPIPP